MKMHCHVYERNEKDTLNLYDMILFINRLWLFMHLEEVSRKNVQNAI